MRHRRRGERTGGVCHRMDASVGREDGVARAFRRRHGNGIPRVSGMRHGRGIARGLRLRHGRRTQGASVGAPAAGNLGPVAVPLFDGGEDLSAFGFDVRHRRGVSGGLRVRHGRGIARAFDAGHGRGVRSSSPRRKGIGIAAHQIVDAAQSAHRVMPAVRADDLAALGRTVRMAAYNRAAAGRAEKLAGAAVGGAIRVAASS